MAIEDDDYWLARMNMTPQQQAAMRAQAEQRARDAYDAATRAMAQAGDKARGLISDAEGGIDRFKTGVQAEMDRMVGRASSAIRRTPIAQAAEAASALKSNYDDMRAANWKDDDKYFHCKGNCEASQLGTTGDWTAMHLANTREVYGQRVKHDPLWDELEDQAANRFGRAEGRSQPASSCSAMCAAYRPAGLPSKY